MTTSMYANLYLSFSDQHIGRVLVLLLLFCTYLYAAVMSVPPLFDQTGFILEPFLLACSVNWVNMSRGYFSLLLSCGYVIPLTCMLVCYVLMLMNVSRAKHGVKDAVTRRQHVEIYLAKVWSDIYYSLFALNTEEDSRTAT